MQRTKIPYLQFSWNPIAMKCTPCSPGCDNCWHLELIRRFGYGIIGKPRLRESDLTAPMSIRKPARIGVQFMGDIAHENVQDLGHGETWATQIWQVVVDCPQHQFLFLSKRAERLRNFYGWGYLYGGGAPSWPLPNAWMGVTVCNQAEADAKIPVLLQIPAAVRWLSIEPMLDSLDLRSWGDIAATPEDVQLPDSWDKFVWPDWVPSGQRKHVESFWGPGNYRKPTDWQKDAVVQHSIKFGARVGLIIDKHNNGWGDVVKENNPLATVHGRFFHCWNNIARVVGDDGTLYPCSFSTGPGYLSKYLCADGDYRHKLHWVVVGCESGPKRRPCKIEWVRSIVEQCKAANVPVFVKQLDIGGKCVTGPAQFPEDLRIREYPEVKP